MRAISIGRVVFVAVSPKASFEGLGRIYRIGYEIIGQPDAKTVCFPVKDRLKSPKSFRGEFVERSAFERGPGDSARAFGRVRVRVICQFLPKSHQMRILPKLVRLHRQSLESFEKIESSRRPNEEN